MDRDLVGVVHRIAQICEPPNPRLSTGLPGKSLARLSHIRTDELPVNTMGDAGGGWAASSAWKRAMSLTQDRLGDRIQRGGRCRGADAAADGDQARGEQEGGEPAVQAPGWTDHASNSCGDGSVEQRRKQGASLQGRRPCGKIHRLP